MKALVSIPFVLLVLSMGCGTAPSAPSRTIQPTAPTEIPPSSLILPAPVSTTAASLAIEAPSVTIFPDGPNYFGYGVRFRLTETGGKSGATIQNVFVGFTDGGGDHTGPSCWRDTIRVPAGATLDTFYTNEGLDWLAYCAPHSGGYSQTPDLHVFVSFTDDYGGSGTIRAVATVSK